jgi:phosphatidylinositol alpha-1,6-mannosyltransferase
MTPHAPITHAALVVAEVFPPAIGGSGELLSNVYRRFHGIPVTVLTEGGNPDQSEKSAEGLNIVRGRMRAPCLGLMQPRGLRHYLRLAIRLRRLGASRPTIVHCARLLPEGVPAWLSRSVGGSPYVCWAHGEEIVSVSSSRELMLLMRRVHKRAAALIANSRNTATMLERVGASRERIEVVHPGVDADRFRPDIPGAAELRARIVRDGELLALTVGRLQRRKGHDLVIRALAALDGRDPQIRYVIVGDGDQRSRLETMAADLGMAGRVLFVGAAPPEQLPAYYAAADVFVHPNRIEGKDLEGFGIVLLEAAAAGLPVIAGDSGGVPEAVAQGETGLLVSGVSVEELQRALLSLASSPSMRRSLGAAGRARVKRDFSWERAAAQVAALHERVAGR